jgi:hypothetical protein
MAYGVVYGLYDPRTMALRYVGQTTGNLEIRVRGHMRGANLHAKRHASHWLRQIKEAGLMPVAKVIREASSRSVLDELEIATIREEREKGSRLTNCSVGGTGAGMRGHIGPSISEEGRKRISEAQRGRKVSLETRAKISAALRGRTLSLETVRKMSESRKGEQHSAEHNAKVSAAKKGKRGTPKTEAQKQHMRTILKGRVTNSPEHMAKLVEMHRGSKRSAESRQRMSEAAKRRHSSHG